MCSRSLATTLVRIALSLPAAHGLAACRAGGPAAGSTPAPNRSAAAASIDRFVHQVVERLPDVPGLAVAIVRDTQLVYLGGAGYRDREARLPATDSTPYYIASSTKSFTALAAAVLAAQGRLDLDAPLSRYLPELRLPAARPADSMTVRQLLSHTMGLENDAVVIRTAYTGEWTPGRLLGLLAGSRVVDRSFHYDNLGYVMAGLAIDRAAGRSWKQVLRGSILAPLGMTRTSAFASEASRWGPAVPYWAGAEPTPRRLPRTKRDQTMHAAGGMFAPARDLARWLLANLNDGRLDGVQALPAAALRETHRLQVRLPQPRRFGPFVRFGYGLGWYWADYEGDTLLQDFGQYDGARAHVSFMPRTRIGVAVLLNASGPVADLSDLVATYAYDVLLGKPAVAARYDALLDSAAVALADAKVRIAADRAQRAGRRSTLSLPLAAYAGTYEGEALGRMRVEAMASSLRISLGPLRATTEFFTRPEAVRVEFGPGRGEVVRFFVSAAAADSLEYEGYVLRRTRVP